MIAIILAGGEGRRIGREKPLVRVNGRRMVDIVVDGVKKSRIDEFFIAISKNTQKTGEYCKLMGYKTLETSGSGYHEDLSELLDLFHEFVSVSCDLPFLKGEHINEMLDAYKGRSITGAVPLEILPQGIVPSYVFRYEEKTLIPCGLNIVTSSEDSSVFIFDDPLLGINVNTKDDLEIAKFILRISPSHAP
jgi:adenosylcobinamide-phosphate guanylyltransferase